MSIANDQAGGMEFSTEEKKGFSGMGTIHRKAHVGIDANASISGWEEIMALIKQEDEINEKEVIDDLNDYANKKKVVVQPTSPTVP